MRAPLFFFFPLDQARKKYCECRFSRENAPISPHLAVFPIHNHHPLPIFHRPPDKMVSWMRIRDERRPTMLDPMACCPRRCLSALPFWCDDFFRDWPSKTSTFDPTTLATCAVPRVFQNATATFVFVSRANALWTDWRKGRKGHRYWCNAPVRKPHGGQTTTTWNQGRKDQIRHRQGMSRVEHRQTRSRQLAGSTIGSGPRWDKGSLSSTWTRTAEKKNKRKHKTRRRQD